MERLCQGLFGGASVQARGSGIWGLGLNAKQGILRPQDLLFFERLFRLRKGLETGVRIYGRERWRLQGWSPLRAQDPFIKEINLIMMVTLTAQLHSTAVLALRRHIGRLRKYTVYLNRKVERHVYSLITFIVA